MVLVMREIAGQPQGGIVRGCTAPATRKIRRFDLCSLLHSHWKHEDEFFGDKAYGHELTRQAVRNLEPTSVPHPPAKVDASTPAMVLSGKASGNLSTERRRR